MKRYLPIFSVSLLLLISSSALAGLPDFAATNLPGSIGKKVEGAVEQAQTVMAQVNDVKSAATQMADAAKQTIGQVQGVVDKVTNIIEDPMGAAFLVGGVVLGGLAQALDGNSGDDEIVTKTKETFNRQFGAADSIAQQYELDKANNAFKGQNMSALYAKALVLRKQLMDEEEPDASVDTVDAALKSVNDLMLQSNLRWSKILEMQAYLSEYEHAIEMQNFVIREESNE